MNDLEVALGGGEPQRDAAVRRLGGGGRAALHQQLHHVQEARLGGAVHRRPAVLWGKDPFTSSLYSSNLQGSAKKGSCQLATITVPPKLAEPSVQSRLLVREVQCH